MDKICLAAPALVLIHDEVRTIKGGKERQRGSSLYHFQTLDFLFITATVLESKSRQLSCGHKENKCESECHECERREVISPDTMPDSNLANLSAAQLERRLRQRRRMRPM